MNQQAVAKAFIGNAVKIRGSPLYCKDDKCPTMSLSGEPDGKTGVRMSPSQETSRLWCVHDLSVGKAVCVAGPGWQCIRMQVSPMKIGEIFLCIDSRVNTCERSTKP